MPTEAQERAKKQIAEVVGLGRVTPSPPTAQGGRRWHPATIHHTFNRTT